MPYQIEPLLDQVVSEKFPSFKYRPHQKEAILQVLENFINKEKKYVILDAPTGSGKSWIARIIAEVMNMYHKHLEDVKAETVFLTKTISLQNQYLNDFKDMRKLVGASNFSCSCKDPNFLPPIAPNNKWHLMCMFDKSSGACEYNKARQAYNTSPLKCLNYAFFFTGADKYSTTGLLICDEAHSLPDYLIDFSKTIINIDRLTNFSESFNIEDYINVTKIRNTKNLTLGDLPDIQKYVIDLYNHIIDRLKETNEKIKTLDSDSLKEILVKNLLPLQNKHDYLKNLLESLNFTVDHPEEIWIIEKEDSERDLIFSVKPIHVQKSSLIYVKLASNVLLMTATGARLKEELKIDENDIETVSIPYNWDTDNRPFISVGTLPPINFRTRDAVIRDYVNYIDNVIDDLDPSDSGIIHTASYKNAEDLIKLTRHKNRIYIPTSEEVREIKKIVKPGRFIASPAILEGISLDGDLARLQIFMKVPYPSLSSEWVVKKKDNDPGWYTYETLLRIVQGSGRAIRSKDDYAVTFMLDPSFINLYQRVKNLIPDWFNKTIIFS